MSVDEPVENYVTRFEKVYEDKPHLKCNKETIEKYLAVSCINRSDQTKKQRYQAFTLFSKWCKISFSAFTHKDMDDFILWLSKYEYEYKKSKKKFPYSPYTIQVYKIIYKQFFKSKHFEVELSEEAQLDRRKRKEEEEDHEINRQEILNSIAILKEDELKTLYEKHKDGNVDKEILTQQEVSKMIGAAKNDRDAMMLAVLYESGCRKGELRSCKVKHVTFYDRYCTLKFPTGKKGGRTVELVTARPYLDGWVRGGNKHPQKLPNGLVDPEAYLLVSTIDPEIVDGREIYKQLSETAITKQIKKLAKRTGVTKPVNPHNFRSTRATHLAENPNWSEQAIKEYQGWKKSSRMLDRYVKKVETKNAVLKSKGIELDETVSGDLPAIICPNCRQPQKEEIRDVATHCYSCGSPLTADAIAKHEKDVTTASLELMRDANDNKWLEDIIKSKIEELYNQHKTKDL